MVSQDVLFFCGLVVRVVVWCLAINSSVNSSMYGPTVLQKAGAFLNVDCEYLIRRLDYFFVVYYRHDSSFEHDAAQVEKFL